MFVYQLGCQSVPATAAVTGIAAPESRQLPIHVQTTIFENILWGELLVNFVVILFKFSCDLVIEKSFGENGTRF